MSEDETKKKITLKSPAPTQAPQKQPSDDTATLRPKKLLSKNDGGAPAKAPTEVPNIADPMTMSDTDTSRLKRIKPQSSVTTDSTITSMDDSLNTETVHLKVIKEKKKQLAGILSASQTIRLRPSTGGESAPTQPAPGGAPTLSSTKTGSIPSATIQRRTLKVKAPSVSETNELSSETQNLRRPAAAGGPSKRPTLKIKAPSGTSEAVTQASEAVEAPAPAKGGGRSTLKIKAPSSAGMPAAAPTAEAPAGPQARGKSTLKIKAPSGAPTQEAAPSPAAPNKTTRQEAPQQQKTLKLKPKSQTQTQEASPIPAPPGAPQAAPQPQAPAGRKTATNEVQPGIFYTLSAAASLALMGGVAFTMFKNFTDLFS